MSINASFRHHYGCDATEVVAALSVIIDICESRVQAHMEDMRAWMALFGYGTVFRKRHGEISWIFAERHDSRSWFYAWMGTDRATCKILF
ncbi:hypothetical protein [Rhizobium rhizogenes]|uniref:hypothetical protein n=1 Tax=Rhizobium rhizogenes TaxID=359 RepID=UPI00115DCB71|nr:hypothetical protein [Rhizobium rhizogenes]TRB19695.1 hypothetical protein EXN70_27720 [Rhizobium rhizogenes]